MSEDALHLTFAAKGSNAEPWLGEGWHHAEDDHRWTDGLASVIRLPAFKPQPWFALTLQCWPFNPPGVTQSATLNLNGVEIASYRPPHLPPVAFVIPGELMRTDGENRLVIHHPDAASPARTQQGSRDTRWVSLAFQRLDVQPLDAPLHVAPRLLPQTPAPEGAAAARAVLAAFQSLGQRRGLGRTQPHCEAEPLGLLSFASVLPENLVKGLRTRFEGVGDVGQLSFVTDENKRFLIGRHALYGLDFQTFKLAGETDVVDLALKEAQRLATLARRFFEQRENDEEICLRLGGFESPGEALALHLLLRAYHPRARLLIVDDPPAHAPERAGRVIELRPGLYRGYFPVATGPEEWLRLCATVLAVGVDADAPGYGSG